MPITVHSAVIPAGSDEALTEALSAVGFTAWSTASRNDGADDLTLYAVDGPLPAAVTAALAGLGIATAVSGSGTAESLVAGYLPDQPCELCPGVWIDPTGGLPAEPGRTILRLPPSLAFGDGHHPSTRMIAGFLTGLDLAGARVLDLGCGTGVLGTLALLRGAATCDFTDVDEAALAATRRALADHGLHGRVFASDLLTGVDGPYQVLIANLYADLVLAMLDDPRLAEVLPSGVLLLSGIHVRHRDALRTRLADRGFTIAAEREEAWWCSLLARR